MATGSSCRRVTPQKNRSLAQVLVSRDKITSRDDVLSLLEKITRTGKPLVIVAEDVEGAALASLVVNTISKSIQVAAARPSGAGTHFDQALDNIATLAGTGALNGQTVLRDIQISDLGQAKRIIIEKYTMFIEGRNKGTPDMAMEANGHR